MTWEGPSRSTQDALAAISAGDGKVLPEDAWAAGIGITKAQGKSTPGAPMVENAHLPLSTGSLNESLFTT